MANCLTLLAEYDQTAAKIQGRDPSVSIGVRWDEEVEDTKLLLGKGNEVGKGQIAAILQQSNVGVKSPELSVAARLLQMDAGERNTGRWAKAAKKQGKAVRRLVRTLPVE